MPLGGLIGGWTAKSVRVSVELRVLQHAEHHVVTYVMAVLHLPHLFHLGEAYKI